MFSFKKWFYKENLQGPGGGPEWSPDNIENLSKNIVAHGAGAFPCFDNLPRATKTISSKYADKRFMSKLEIKRAKNNKTKK